jgi:hypothetical protein
MGLGRMSSTRDGSVGSSGMAFISTATRSWVHPPLIGARDHCGNRRRSAEVFPMRSRDLHWPAAEERRSPCSVIGIAQRHSQPQRGVRRAFDRSTHGRNMFWQLARR